MSVAGGLGLARQQFDGEGLVKTHDNVVGINGRFEWHATQERSSHRYKLRGAKGASAFVVGIAPYVGWAGQVSVVDWKLNHSIPMGLNIRYAINTKLRTQLDVGTAYYPGNSTIQNIGVTIGLNYKIIRRTRCWRWPRWSGGFGYWAGPNDYGNRGVKSFQSEYHGQDHHKVYLHAYNDFAVDEPEMLGAQLFMPSTPLDHYRNMDNRLTVQLTGQSDRPLLNVKTTLVDSAQNIIASGVTGNTGKVELWLKDAVEISGQEQVLVETGNTLITFNVPVDRPMVAFQLEDSVLWAPQSNVMFVVEASEQMWYRFKYLKAELKTTIHSMSVISKGTRHPKNFKPFRGIRVFHGKGEPRVGVITYNKNRLRKVGLSRSPLRNELFISRTSKGKVPGHGEMYRALNKAINGVNWEGDATGRVIVLVASRAPDTNDLRPMQEVIEKANKAGIRIVTVQLDPGSVYERELLLRWVMRTLSRATDGVYLQDQDIKIPGDTLGDDIYTTELNWFGSLVQGAIYQMTRVVEQGPGFQFEQYDSRNLSIDSVVVTPIEEFEFGKEVHSTYERKVEIYQQKASDHSYDERTREYVGRVDTLTFVRETFNRQIYFEYDNCGEFMDLRAEMSVQEVIIADLEGKALKRFGLEKGVNKRVDCDELPVGEYYLRVRVGENQYVSRYWEKAAKYWPRQWSF